MVYYSSNKEGINGSKYAFRNSELLYEDYRSSGGETILGKNYKKYTEEFKSTFLEAVINMGMEELQDELIEYALEKGMKLFKEMR